MSTPAELFYSVNPDFALKHPAYPEPTINPFGSPQLATWSLEALKELYSTTYDNLENYTYGPQFEPSWPEKPEPVWTPATPEQIGPVPSSSVGSSIGSEPGPAVTFGDDLYMPDGLLPGELNAAPGERLGDELWSLPSFHTPDYIDIETTAVYPTHAQETPDVSIWSQLGTQLLGGIVSGLGSTLAGQLGNGFEEGGDLPALPGGFTTGGYLEQGTPGSLGYRRRRRMDPCNSKALMRAARRLTMYSNMNRKIDKALRRAVPARLRGGTHRKGKR